MAGVTEPRSLLAALEIVGKTKFPLLRQAAGAAVPAVRERIDWLGADGKAHENYCQIVRTRYGLVGAANQREAVERIKNQDKLGEHLRKIEDVLQYGVAEWQTERSVPLGWCGGVWNFLGRDFEEGDSLVLRPMVGRELLWRKVSDDPFLTAVNQLDYPSFEWISEFSLEVRPVAAVA